MEQQEATLKVCQCILWMQWWGGEEKSKQTRMMERADLKDRLEGVWEL